MKKLLIAIFALFLCAAVGLGIFIATFDADRYRPLLLQKASEALNMPVELGHLSLTWNNGLALHLKNLSLHAAVDKKIKSVQIPKADVVVRLKPLLHKEIQIASIIAQDGQVDFDDLSVRDVDIKVKDFSLTRQFSFEVIAAVAGDEQNARIHGLLQLPQKNQKGFFEKTTVQIGLADLDLETLAKAIPATRSLGLEGNLGGRLELHFDRVVLEPQAIQNLKASAQWKNGAIKPRSLPGPLEKIQLSVDVSDGDIKIENFSANFLKGTLQVSGTIRQFQTQALSDFKCSASDLDIDVGNDQTPHLGGHLSFDFAGKASGIGWPQIAQTLSGQGRLVLKDGVLLNFNLIRKTIEKISIIPGAQEAIERRLPDFYKAKLNEPSTPLQPIDWPFFMQNGTLFFDRLMLVTELLLIEGYGQVGLDKTVQISANMHIHQNLSGALVNAVPLIQPLLNSQGEIQIPATIHGQLPKIKVTPDKEYLTQKLIASQAQDLVMNLVQKPGQTLTGDSSLDFKNILNQALGKVSKKS